MDSNNSRPSTIECHLTNDLTDAVVPGDVIDVIAVVKVTADPDPRTKGVKAAGGDNQFVVYLDVLSIDNGAQNQNDKSQVNFSMLEMTSIAEIFGIGMCAKNGKIVQLMCPLCSLKKNQKMFIFSI